MKKLLVMLVFVLFFTWTNPAFAQSGTPTISSTKVWTQYAPWHLDIYGTNMVSTSKARLFDSNGTQWGSDIGLYLAGGSTTASSIALPSNNPPSGCNIGKTCRISVQIVTSTNTLSNKYSFTLPAYGTATPPPPGAPTITGTKVWTQYAPWHLDIYGTKMISTSKARLFDSNGSQWGTDIGLYVAGGSTTASSIALPSNNPPSGCNAGKTCTISVQIVTSTNVLSNKFNVTLPAYGTTTPPPTTKVVITVSDWNAFWSPRNVGHEEKLAPKQWHYRLPFYSKIISENSVEIRHDNQETIDKEIQFAAASGIDSMSFFYWSFTGLNPRATNPNALDMNSTLRLYLSSSYKNSLKFSVTAPLYQITYQNDYVYKWDTQFIPQMINFMKDSQYQKVTADQRPIVYFLLSAQEPAPEQITEQQLKDAIQRFRSQSQSAGLPNPYIVLTDGNSARASSLGADAVSSYSSQQYGIPNTFSGGKLWPYSDLVTSSMNGWTQWASAGFPLVQNLNVGWDYRPAVPSGGSGDYGESPIFEKGTPQEIANHISGAIAWASTHKSNNPSQNIYIYAWAENVEGGWLAPTIYDGDERLQAIAKLLKGSYFTSPRYKGRDINGDRSIDIFDYGKLVSDFGKNLDPIPKNADITADGKVDIMDYNELLPLIGK